MHCLLQLAVLFSVSGDDGRLLLLRADWTRPDDAIAAFLASYGRFGIPFNIVIPADETDVFILPEILTSGSVMQALENAGVTAK